MFMIDLQPTHDFAELSFVPHPEQWEEVFREIFEIWISSVEGMEPLLNDEIYEPFTWFAIALFYWNIIFFILYCINLLIFFFLQPSV